MPEGSRVAVRILLLDQSSRVLLFEGRDLSDAGDTVRFWFTAGGGVDEGEALLDAAERELLEETGQSGLSLVGPFHRRECDFLNHGEPLHQVEHFFAARTNATSPCLVGWSELAQKVMAAWRWWSTEDLDADNIRFFPGQPVSVVLRASEVV